MLVVDMMMEIIKGCYFTKWMCYLDNDQKWDAETDV